jgi:hypothetical protein
MHKALFTPTSWGEGGSPWNLTPVPLPVTENETQTSLLGKKAQTQSFKRQYSLTIQKKTLTEPEK